MSIPVLPNFTRWSWAGLEARSKWADKFVSAARDMNTIERLAVAETVVPHVFQYVKTNDLTRETHRCLEYGLILSPFDEWDKDKRPITARGAYYRCLITRPDTFRPLLSVISSEGPTCCQIAESVRGEESVDSTYEQLCATTGKPGLASTLWRPMGLRLVPHQPCSYSCEASTQRAKDIIALAEKHGFGEATNTIQEVLSWPFKYTRLFGIAEVVAPVVKFYSRTNWTPTLDKYGAENPHAVAVPVTLYRKS